MTRIIILLLLLVAAMPQQTKAQSDDEQVLIFRNTGEVNLFFTSEIDSIVMSCYDADSVMHDSPVSQVFHTADTALVVPINEIDSVAIGSRNTMEFRDGVRQITADSIWISYFDGNTIHYKSGTPYDKLPKEGELLFYGTMDNLFPVGLTAKVTGVTKGEDYSVDVDNVELGDIFSKFFYAGALNNTTPQSQQASRIPVSAGAKIGGEITVEDYGSIAIGGNAEIEGKAVANPLTGYYNLDATIDLSLEMASEIKGDEISFEGETKSVRIPLPKPGLVLWPELNVSGFAELSGELKLNTRIAKNSRVHYVWERRRGQEDKQITEQLPLDDAKEFNYTAEAEIIADGEVFGGGQINMDMRVLGSPWGARANLKVGPSVSGELSSGVITTLSSNGYNHELYSKASLEACLKLDSYCSLLYYDFKENKENEYQILTASLSLFKQTLNLFPQYEESRAVKMPNNKKEVEVSMATKSKEKIVKSLDTGFQVTDTENNPIDSVFVGRIIENTDSIQGIDTCLVLQQSEIPAETEIVIRPIFHYDGYTIQADKATLMSDMQLQPAVFGQSNGAVTYLSGMPFSGSAQNDSTLVIAGPYLPVPVRDSVFHKQETVVTGIYLTDITGTWNGTENGENVTYTFSDNSGTFASGGTTTDFTYKLNYPQTGYIVMSFNDNTVKALKVTEYGSTSMTCVNPPSTEKFTLYKQ